jgi:hypothetical protein
MTAKIVEYEENVEGKTADDSIQSEAKGKTILRYSILIKLYVKKLYPYLFAYFNMSSFMILSEIPSFEKHI